MGARSEAGGVGFGGGLRICLRVHESSLFSLSSAKLVEQLSFPTESAPSGCQGRGKVAGRVVSELAAVGIANSALERLA